MDHSVIAAILTFFVIHPANTPDLQIEITICTVGKCCLIIWYVINSFKDCTRSSHSGNKFIGETTSLLEGAANKNRDFFPWFNASRK